MPRIYKLKISVSSERDIAALYGYGFERWGEERADLYFDALIEHFDLLCNNPFLLATVDQIRPGYRRSLCGVHSIYYKVTETTVEIMASVGRQDF